MNQQERAVLRDFLDQLVQVSEVQKNPEADAMINRALVQQPDAAYLLVQRALLLELAIAQAKGRIAELERGQSFTDRSFFDSSLPNSSALMFGASTASLASARAPSGVSGQPVQSAGATGSGLTAASMAAQSGSTPSFLGQAAATAAGVAGGAFLFEGVEDLLGHHGSALPGTVAFGAVPPEEVTVNNFYASDNQVDADEPAADSDSDNESDDQEFF
jgi:hypothetical protein